MACEICGAIHGLDQHHIIPRRLGGSRNPDVRDESNLIALCRACHRKIHLGPWQLLRSQDDQSTGVQVMHRLYDSDLDVPGLFHRMNLAEDTLCQLREALPYLSDDQLVEAFNYASCFGKRCWLVQAAVLHEAQQRSIYGDRSLKAIARRFEIGLRQPQKYALVWKVFFTQTELGKNVNFDAILLDEPSWYVVAASETKDPEQWLAYAQDRKMEDPRYSVSAFRSDIQRARVAEPAPESRDFPEALPIELPELEIRSCPWIQRSYLYSGKPVPVSQCQACEFENNKICETKPTSVEA